MAVFGNIEEARAYFEGDRFAMENGMSIDAVGDGTSTCSMVIADRHRNANGGVMGGAIFTLADLAFAAACNNRHRPTVALQVSINYLSGTRGGALYAHARCRKDGKTTCVYDIDVVDDLGRDIAQFVGTGYKL